MRTLVALIGLVLIFEGLPYVAFPDAMQNWLKQITETNPAVLRTFGIIAVAVGLILCFISQRSGLFG